MLLSLFSITPLEALAIVIAFMAALFITMPFHEFAHAHAAVKEGDYTPIALKRYTLAPFAHVDVKGLIFLLIFGIGYAKPVPVDSRNFKRGTKSKLRVAFAGVLMNLLLGTISCVIYAAIATFLPSFFEDFGFLSMLYENFFAYMITLNFMFAFFNILPIYPLDGYRAIEAISKPNNGFLAFMRHYGFWIMFGLLLTGVLWLYIDFFAYGLADLIMNGLGKLFALMV